MLTVQVISNDVKEVKMLYEKLRYEIQWLKERAVMRRESYPELTPYFLPGFDFFVFLLTVLIVVLS